MTEAEWRSTDDWRAMLAWLAERPIPDRKWALYLCGGLRQIWDRWLYSDHSRNAVEVAERAADGLVTEEEARKAAYMAEVPTFGYDFEPSFVLGLERRFSADMQRLIAMGVIREEELGLDTVPDCRSRTTGGDRFEIDPADQDDVDRLIASGRSSLGDPAVVEQLIHAANVAEGCFTPTSERVYLHLVQFRYWPGAWLLREVFGNPLAPIAFDPAWRTEAVVGLATGIYDDKAFERLPILADALEEAGCDNANILSHCREPGIHVRGCWVVDLVLGKA